ncbi:MAG: chorismate mutase [Clostridia bacterium]|nr:chorismate mutase [Clostridia bacterium]
MDIKDLREEINGIDEELVSLFNKRMKLSLRIAQYKKENNLSVFDKAREEEIINKVITSSSPENRDYIKKLYEDIFSFSRSLQENHINGQYGLLGENLSHSYSPEIHSFLGDYSYTLFEKEIDEVAPFLEKREFNAINVTIPYKKTVMRYLDRLDETAEKICSVNTIIKESDGTLTGYNTDYYGFSYMLSKGNIQVTGKKILILGDGGASATVQTVVKDLEAKEIIVVSRHTDTNYDNIHLHYDADVIINTTPVGMYPENGATLVDLDKFKNLSGVADLIYNPVRTKLILDAEKRGINCISGLYMLSAQGKKAAELFFKKQYDDSIIDFITEKLTFQMKNIVLVSMPGAGKTTLGKLLAEHYGRKFIDTDDLITEKTGKSIPDIFDEYGEEYFRKTETQVIKEICKEKSLVIATGGGAVIKEENHDALRQNSTVIFINRNIDSLATDSRPLSMKNNLYEMYQKRLPLYKAVCHYEVDGNGTIEEVAERIGEILK